MDRKIDPDAFRDWNHQCPNCATKTEFNDWEKIGELDQEGSQQLWVGRCSQCKSSALWKTKRKGAKMVPESGYEADPENSEFIPEIYDEYDDTPKAGQRPINVPEKVLSPPPHCEHYEEQIRDSLPEESAELYEEASKTHRRSPRASVVLLRVAMESFCHDLGANSEENLFEKIGTVAETTDSIDQEHVVRAFHVARDGANTAAHVDEDTEWDPAEANEVFQLFNHLVEELTIRAARREDVEELFKESLDLNQRTDIENKQLELTRFRGQ